MSIRSLKTNKSRHPEVGNAGGTQGVVTLVTWVVVAEVTFSVVTVRGDTAESLPREPAFTCRDTRRHRVTTKRQAASRTHTHTHTHVL